MKKLFGRLRVFALALGVLCSPVFAAELVTWSGTNGVSNSGILNVCADCHFAGGQSPQLTSLANFQANRTLVNSRIQDGTMPPVVGGFPAGDRDFISAWSSNLFANISLPHAATVSAISISKTSATLRGNYNENGSNTDYIFQWGTSIGNLNQTLDVNPDPTGTGGSGIGTSTQPDSGGGVTNEVLTELNCGIQYYFRLSGTNGAGTSNGSTLNFTTSACNNRPTFTNFENNSATEDVLWTYLPTVNNPDGGTVTYRILPGNSMPTGMTLNTSTGLLSWTPTEGQTFTTFTLQVSDSIALADGQGYTSTTISISVTPVNDPPVIGNVNNINGTEQVAITPVQATVTDPDDANNGSDLVWSLINAPGGMSISTTGLISWTPQEGFTGPQTVTVQVCDGGPLCDTDTFSASASAVNDPPVITSSAPATATEEVTYSYQLLYTDPDAGDSHSFDLSNEPAGMTVSSSGLITWTPDDDDLPSVSNITLTVTDGGSLSDSEIFSIAITSVNDQPRITSTATPSVLEGDLYSYQLSVLDADDLDWPNELEFYLVNEPQGMAVDENGLITWQTTEADPSPATITVGVRDGGEDATVADEQDFDIEVIAYNYQPDITSTAPTSATEDVLYSYQLAIDDVDDANDGSGALTFSLDNEPTGMTVSNTGLITWTPIEGVNTSGAVTVSVTDGGEDGTVAATEDFTISVTAVNDAPQIISSAPPSVIEMNTWTYQVQVSDPDDSDPSSEFSFALSNEPPGMTVDETGFITWYAPEAAGTSGDVTLTVSDGGEDGAAPAVQVFNVNVIVFNTPPVITSQAPTSATEDVLYQYEASVADVDDANNGIDLSWSLTNAPAGMQVSPTGLVSWTPTEGVATSGTVTLTVADGGEDAAPGFSEQFTINVVAVNDAPQITSTAPSSAAQGVLLSYQVQVLDPDDSNNGSNLLFSLNGQPPGMLISSTGLLSWTPDESSPLSSNITITVADGGEDGAQPATQSFTLSVVFDIDLDGILNEDDNCELVSNADQANNDGDAFGDACDFDDDNDGMSDDFENANGFDPFDPADAGQDADGDGLTNLEEFLEGTNPFGDDNAPHITLPLNNLWISTGYLTWVDIGQAVATDAFDGSVDITPSRESGGFRPGRHEIVWTATDSSGNTATATQVIRVLPLIAIAPAQVTGEGKTVIVELSLNGEAPEDPATVNYRVEGTASTADHNAVNGSLSFANGRAELAIDIAADNEAEGEETLLISLRNPINAALGAISSQEITIVEAPMAPRVELHVMQGGETGTVVNRVEGNITVTALVNDINAADTFNYDWSLTDNNLVALNGSGTSASSTFEFDATSIATGLYPVHVNVTDSGGLSSGASVLLSVQSSTAVTDSDDNGILDSADNIEAPYALQTTNGETPLETSTHLRLSTGPTVRHVGLNGAALTVQDVQNFGNNGFQAANGLTPYSFNGGLFDFVISDLNSTANAKVIIEQLSPIEVNAEFRAYRTDGGWSTFAEDDFNFVESAPSDNGICPPIGDLEYVIGLVEGHDCVQLTVQDGGPNDGDGEVNGKVTLLGGVGTRPNSGGGGNGGEEPNGDDDGGGSMNWYMWLLLTGLVALHFQSTIIQKK